MKFIKSKIFVVIVFGVLCAATAAGLFFARQYLNNRVAQETKKYLDIAHEIERGVVEHVPIYEDFSSPEKEANLRKYLLPDHLRMAAKTGQPPVEDDDDLVKRTGSGEFEQFDSGLDKMYYFYNVPRKYRCLRKDTLRGLEALLQRYQENLNARHSLPVVKLAISSAVRPVSYQNNLRSRNGNASFESSHSYGISFDIFYDDYLVSLPDSEVPGNLAASNEVLKNLRPQLGYLMGDALSRQFRSVLMDTLIQLQNEGLLYAILEKNQRCYHVTILAK